MKRTRGHPPTSGWLKANRSKSNRATASKAESMIVVSRPPARRSYAGRGFLSVSKQVGDAMTAAAVGLGYCHTATTSRQGDAFLHKSLSGQSESMLTTHSPYPRPA